MSVTEPWTPSSWRTLPALQQPDWPDPAAVEAVRERLGQLPPLVFAGEARALQHALAEAVEGRAFLLQAGDCASKRVSMAPSPTCGECIRRFLALCARNR